MLRQIVNQMYLTSIEVAKNLLKRLFYDCANGANENGENEQCFACRYFGYFLHRDHCYEAMDLQGEVEDERVRILMDCMGEMGLLSVLR